MLFCLFGDVDLFVAVLGRAYDFDDGDGGGVDVVYCLYLIAHGLENGFDLCEEGGSVDLAVEAVGDCDDIDIGL